MTVVFFSEGVNLKILSIIHLLLILTKTHPLIVIKTVTVLQLVVEMAAPYAYP